MRVTDLTPMWPVHDMDAACAFMSECLGFETLVRSEGHAYCRSGSGAIRIINAAPDADLDDPACQMHFYIDCEDVDERYQRHKDALEALPKGFVKPPFDTHWGQREFHVIHAQAQFSVGQPLRDQT